MPPKQSEKRKARGDSPEPTIRKKKTSTPTPTTEAPNAFTALMARPAPRPSPRPPPSFPTSTALGTYLTDPSTFPPSVVITFTPHTVSTRDLYPKSSIHTLLLPRSTTYTLSSPWTAFQDAPFLSLVREDALKLRCIVAADLKRRFGRFSEKERRRKEWIEGGRMGEEVKGRDWEGEVKMGFHAMPSMANLHVHVLSVDMYSVALKSAKHYNTFNTPFFVDLMSDFGTEIGGEEEAVKGDLVCWRCKKNFGRAFKKLKEHLDVEFEAWKKE